jgi:dolichyl-phosphate-mannose-protein mannosyltransferase
VREWRAGQPAAAAFEPVRLLLPLLGVGSLFAVLEALRPGDLAFFRIAMALANTAGMLGAFLLARRLGGTFAGGIAALVLAAVHPSYSVQTGRLYPDPVTGCLFVWSAWLYVEGLERWRARWFAAAGFALAAGLFVRSRLRLQLLRQLQLRSVSLFSLWSLCLSLCSLCPVVR